MLRSTSTFVAVQPRSVVERNEVGEGGHDRRFVATGEQCLHLLQVVITFASRDRGAGAEICDAVLHSSPLPCGRGCENFMIVFAWVILIVEDELRCINERPHQVFGAAPARAPLSIASVRSHARLRLGSGTRASKARRHLGRGLLALQLRTAAIVTVTLRYRFGLFIKWASQWRRCALARRILIRVGAAKPLRNTDCERAVHFDGLRAGRHCSNSPARR